jgi:LysR family hydrogen peroxide-inducible transcriptional activator
LVYSREFLKKNLIEAFADVIQGSIPDDLRTQEEKMVIE